MAEYNAYSGQAFPQCVFDHWRKDENPHIRKSREGNEGSEYKKCDPGTNSESNFIDFIL
jgi:hypothetical protein